MIILKQLIKEVTVPTHNGFAYFTASPGKRGIIFIAKSNKDLDKLETLLKSNIEDMLLDYLTKKFKVIFKIDRSYRGAGYYFEIDLFDMVKKIN